MDNAVRAARNTQSGDRFIRLDLRVKEGFFIFCCANSMPLDEKTGPAKQRGPLAPHGYGLKIIDRILKQAGGFSRIETETGRFQITFALPLQ